jgi:hypothetical protein
MICKKCGRFYNNKDKKDKDLPKSKKQKVLNRIVVKKV